MNIQTKQHGNEWILYDADLITPSPEHFSCKTLETRNLVVGQSDGRGQTCFYRHENQVFALRHYQRGGLIAKLFHDSYFGLVLKQTRAWKEWYLLKQMRELSLPVPQPVAARVLKQGLFYRADLITVYIAGSATLASLLESTPLTDELWQSIGRCIANFHNNSIYHSDLNAKNIMLDEMNKVYLIDFDQCRIRPGGKWQNSNLERLRRSLDKFKIKNNGFNFSESDWQQLQQGYNAAIL